MSEASHLVELREAAPRAPESLRQVVGALPSAQARRSIPWAPAVAAGVALTLGAAVIGGLSHSTDQNPNGSSAAARDRAFTQAGRAQTARPSTMLIPDVAPELTAKRRLQRQDVAMSLRVKDLSGATQSAVRTTRRLGGFVASADYSTRTDTGDSRLTLRVPVANLQMAIASFTGLGTILSQHISVADLQPGVDRLDKRIAGARRAGHERQAAQLLRRRAALVREGTYAKVSLQLTTTKPAAKHVVPSRFDRFWDNTKDILGKELIAVLYALVIAGPFVLLAALLILGERVRRRRADHRLLEETG